jgi:hypothetical protein
MRVLVPGTRILFVEALRIELLRIRVIIFIVMNSQDRNHNSSSLLDDYVLIWYFVVFDAVPCDERNRRVLPQSLWETEIKNELKRNKLNGTIEHLVQVLHFLHGVVSDFALVSRQDCFHLVSDLLLNLLVLRQVVQSKSHGGRSSFEAGQEEDEALGGDFVHSESLAVVLVPFFFRKFVVLQIDQQLHKVLAGVAVLLAVLNRVLHHLREEIRDVFKESVVLL